MVPIGYVGLDVRRAVEGVDRDGERSGFVEDNRIGGLLGADDGDRRVLQRGDELVVGTQVERLLRVTAAALADHGGHGTGEVAVGDAPGDLDANRSNSRQSGSDSLASGGRARPFGKKIVESDPARHRRLLPILTVVGSGFWAHGPRFRYRKLAS